MRQQHMVLKQQWPRRRMGIIVGVVGLGGRELIGYSFRQSAGDVGTQLVHGGDGSGRAHTATGEHARFQIFLAGLPFLNSDGA